MINDLTPGTSYTTESGISYGNASPAAIPEPSVVLLLSGGLPILFLFRKFTNSL